MAYRGADPSGAPAAAAAPDVDRCTDPRPLDPRRLVHGRLGVLGYNARVGVCIALVFAAGGAVRDLLDTTGGLGAAALDTREVLLGWAAIALGLGASACIPFFSVRRLHDLGRGGAWWFLTLVPVINVLVQLLVQFFPGSAEPNRFGPAPRPGAGERLVGLVALVGIAILLLDQAWQLHSRTLPSRDPAPRAASAPTPAPTDDAHEAELERLEALLTAEGVKAERVEDEATFRRLFVGRPLVFVGTRAHARFRFEADGTLRGTYAFPDGRTDDAALRWSWEADRYCREGRIADVDIPRECGLVDHVPGTGMRIRYEAIGDELWLMR